MAQDGSTGVALMKQMPKSIMPTKRERRADQGTPGRADQRFTKHTQTTPRGSHTRGVVPLQKSTLSINTYAKQKILPLPASLLPPP